MVADPCNILVTNALVILARQFFFIIIATYALCGIVVGAGVAERFVIGFPGFYRVAVQNGIALTGSFGGLPR